MSTRYLIGDVFDGLATIPDNSVDLIVSSPPFLALRSYLPADHEHKALEIGSEATPGAFLDKLLDVVEECARVLAPHGSLVFELGDTHAGARQATGEFNGGEADGRKYERHEGRDQWERDHPISRVSGTRGSPGGKGWPLDKSKVLVPQLFAIALAYGFNPLTGRTTDPWRIRNTVAWCRPNPPVGRDGDKFRPATSFLTVATKARDRYWDGDAVRQKNNPERMDEPSMQTPKYSDAALDERTRKNGGSGEWNPAGAPLLDYWVIPTEPYSGSHYATFPRALVVPLVKSMCPSRVCRVCGEPSRRIVEQGDLIDQRGHVVPMTDRRDGDFQGSGSAGKVDGGITRRNETLGWSDCGCSWPEPVRGDHDWGLPAPSRWRPGLVLDPFAGSGTTLAVASGHGLDSIGIDIDHRNAELAAERVGGLFLEVEQLNESSAAIPDEPLRSNDSRFRKGYQSVHLDTGRVQGPRSDDYGARRP